MSSGGDPLRDVQRAVFNGNQSPLRPHVQFFHDAMRWPVDAFATHTEVDGDHQFLRHHIAWIRGGLLGFATFDPAMEHDTVVHVHPLQRIRRIDVRAHVYDDGYENAVQPALTVEFDDGQQLTLDPGEMALDWQRPAAAPFIDTVLAAVEKASAGG